MANKKINSLFKEELSKIYQFYKKSNKTKRSLLAGSFSVLMIGFIFSVYSFTNTVIADIDPNPQTATTTIALDPQGYILVPQYPGVDFDPTTMAGFSVNVSVNSCQAYLDAQNDITTLSSYLKKRIENLASDYYTSGCASDSPNANCASKMKVINNLFITYGTYKLENLKMDFEKAQDCENPEDDEDFEYVIAPWYDIDFASMAYESIKETYLDTSISNSSQLFSTLNNKLRQKFDGALQAKRYFISTDRSQINTFSSVFFKRIASKSESFDSSSVSSPTTSEYLTSFYLFGIDYESPQKTIVPLIFDSPLSFHRLYRNNPLRFDSMWGEQNLGLRDRTTRILDEVIIPETIRQGEPDISGQETNQPQRISFIDKIKEGLKSSLAFVSSPIKVMKKSFLSASNSTSTATSTPPTNSYATTTEPIRYNGLINNPTAESCLNPPAPELKRDRYISDGEYTIWEKDNRLLPGSVSVMFDNFYHPQELPSEFGNRGVKGENAKLSYTYTVTPGERATTTPKQEKILDLYDKYFPNRDGSKWRDPLTPTVITKTTNLEPKYEPCLANYNVFRGDHHPRPYGWVDPSYRLDMSNSYYKLVFLYKTFHVLSVSHDALQQTAGKEFVNPETYPLLMYLKTGETPAKEIARLTGEQILVIDAERDKLFERAREDELKRSLEERNRR